MDEQIQYQPVGYVKSPRKEATDENWGKVVSRINLKPEYSGGLDGLADFSHVIVITHLHRAKYVSEKHLQRRPRGLASMPLVGIFCQRVKDRPNSIGVTAVRVKAVGPHWLEVEGLDAIDGTPVLDIKPYYPVYDHVPSPKVPPWVDELMMGYF